MIDKLAAIPGVSGAAFASGAPLERINNENDLLYAEDKNYSPGQIPPIRPYRYISPGFLKVDGTPLIAGRDFTWTDVYEKRHVAMVSENLAREMWGSPAAALGKQVRSGLNDPWREIVGVVGDVYDDGVDQKAPSIAYWPPMMDQFRARQIACHAVWRVRGPDQSRGHREFSDAGAASHLVRGCESAGVPGANAPGRLRRVAWRGLRSRWCCSRSPARWRCCWAWWGSMA